MKDFGITRYLEKYWKIILIGSFLTGFLFHTFAKQNLQEYTAATVIEYTNGKAEQGLAPDNTKIDPTEIYASNIIIQAMNELELDFTDISVDELRSGIRVEPIVTEEERLTKESKIEKGEEYEQSPTRYLVTFSSDISRGKEFPRRILNQVLQEYFTYYGENHVNTSAGSNNINDIYEKGYDYLEMAELIEDSLAGTIKLLADKVEVNGSFRSSRTGYSFSDLRSEFSFIRNVEIAQLTADILYHKVTKNRDVLISKYSNRKNDLSIANDTYAYQTDKIREIIASYEDAMKRFEQEYDTDDNSGIVYNNILPQVYEDYRKQESEDGTTWEPVDRTTEYDQLLMEYTEKRTRYEYNSIDSDYAQYVIDVFRNAPAESSEVLQNETMERIQVLVDKINVLYQNLYETNDEYNDYLGAQNVAVLASVGVAEKFPLKLFTAMVVVVFGVFGCLGSIILGRLGDLVEYYAFTNKIDGLPNRAKCDRYISAMEKKILPSRFACIVLKMTNLEQENSRLGRSTGDEMMKEFARTLTSIFIPSKKTFVGYNGSGQYLIFSEELDRKRVNAALEQFELMIHQKEGREYDINYQASSACSEEEKCYYIRELISMAMSRLNKGNKKENVLEKEEMPEILADEADNLEDWRW